MRKLYLPILLLLIFMVANSFFIIKEGQQAIVLQFGKPVGGSITDAGLHMKIPFVQKVIHFEKRILEWDGASSEIPTKDDTKSDQDSDGFAYILIDAYARWEIIDPLKFYKTVKNETMAQSRLDDIIDGALRDQISNSYVSEIIKSSSRLEQIACEKAKGIWISGYCSVDIGDNRLGIRREIASSIVEKAQKKVVESDMGIRIIDVQFKRIKYNTGVQQQLFRTMISEQRIISEKYKAEGEALKESISGDILKDQAEITSTAELKSKKIRGTADALALKIYAESYEKDPDFYNFKRTLDSYEISIDPTTKIILSTDNKYLRYLNP